ncbi:DUF3833 domain-containing protein [Aestuariibacter salexigens]|uniref:DUF3833 domain-containing protein n=1 Tax=Aestuariibacter salexigens TaxID=226010 RepID=UPI0003F9D611|nr:DUF3833 domain-containing protein [Aestuariibacter salexigens]
MKFITVVLITLWLTGCAGSIEGEQYQNIGPKFDLQGFFNGDVKAWGIVQDRSGNVVQRFTVDIAGSMQDGKLVLDETFDYAVGEGPEKRIWTITAKGDNAFEGQASDIAGPAQGRVFGNALYWQYEMDLPVSGSTYRVNFEDWMWAFDDKTLMNRSYIKKFGITFAEVTLFMQRQSV